MVKSTTDASPILGQEKSFENYIFSSNLSKIKVRTGVNNESTTAAKTNKQEYDSLYKTWILDLGLQVSQMWLQCIRNKQINTAVLTIRLASQVYNRSRPLSSPDPIRFHRD